MHPLLLKLVKEQIHPVVKDVCVHVENTAPTDDFSVRHRMAWAPLMARIFAENGLEYPKCSSRMQQIEFVIESHSITKILSSLKNIEDSL